ncbi:hypothetical protein [Sphingosinicella terrae]|uniref:hypothetical protein n=1 Tax=Sphingosinicella terrae TaxID=2172047 RepID=UPI000E0DB5AD|nr:hypothetical protein [Sphingosinicella terrae]
MLFHLSIDADDPRHVAHVFAEIWGGRAFPFPSVIDGSWVALAGDDRGTMIEVYPRGTELRENGRDGAFGFAGPAHRFNPVHMAMATNLDADTVIAIARREGWEARVCLRGGVFGVIEMWVEGCQMVEVLTPEMQRQYLDAITIANWERMLEAQPLDQAA